MMEHEHEPVPGLPERLPQGETVLWQGGPRWQDLALHTFHMRLVALYFVGLAAWRATILTEEGASTAAVATGVLWLLALGVVPVLIILAFSMLSARTTLYTITNRRVVLRVGVALPMTVNIPYALVESAGLRRHGACGDIALSLTAAQRVSFVALWPHARPFRWSRPEPVLRALPDAEAAAQVLARALAAHAALPVAAHQAEPSRSRSSAGPATAAA